MSRSVAIIGTRGYPSYYGGFETAVRKLAPYLAERGWDVTVYGRPGTTLATDPLIDLRVKRLITRGVESKSLSTLSYGFTSCLDAARRRPDVALVMNVANGYFLPLLRLRRIPTLVNVDGIEWDRAKWGRLAKAMFHYGARWTARHGTRLVYDSREIARRWKKEFETDGDFIPYGGDLPPELPIESGLLHRNYILVVARFVPENTIPEFLVAAEKLALSHDVVVVGSAGYGGELDRIAAEMAARLPRFRWLGHVSDDSRLHSLWQHAGVYFHGHSVGGTNPALVQAMACGAPIVARTSPYNLEVLGDRGSFTDPDPDSIRRAIQSMLGNSLEQDASSTNALERSEKEYTWLKVCEAYESSLESLINARSV